MLIINVVFEEEWMMMLEDGLQCLPRAEVVRHGVPDLFPRCATVFPGPNGMGASFNRTLWRAKGRVLSTEVRAFANANGHRDTFDAH